MKITEALKTAQAHVFPIRHGSQWVIASPWRDIGGPTTHSVPMTYHQALLSTACKRAALAVRLMGGNTDDTAWACTAIEYLGDDWRAVVRDIVRRRKLTGAVQ